MAGRLLAVCSIAILIGFSVGCGSSAELSSITVTPATAIIGNSGGTAAFQATGEFTNGKNGVTYTQNLTNQVTWSSSVTNVATIDSTGLATATGCGTTTISATGGNGGIIGTATLGVCIGFSGELQSITLVSASRTVENAGEKSQYVVIGNYLGEPATRDLTNQVTWLSSNHRVATIDSEGLATATAACPQSGETVITAVAHTSDGRVVTAQKNLGVGSCGAERQPTLTVYKVGQGSGRVISANTGINCGSDNGCTASFGLNSEVNLTAVASPGSVFVGWSSNCKSSQNGACTLTMVNNETVAAIFKLAQ